MKKQTGNTIYSIKYMHLLEFIMKDMDILHESEDMLMNISIDAERREEEKELHVTLSIALVGEDKESEEGNNGPSEKGICIAGTINGCFGVSGEVNDNTLEQFANINAAALLYSEMRPTIKMMSTQYGEDPVILPFFNFVKRYEEMIEARKV